MERQAERAIAGVESDDGSNADGGNKQNPY
ncbi:hypothetical protein V6Z12_D10G168000 [Gossypium hirsutum]